MPRIVKEHVVRRNEIIDAARKLVYTKGYEQMTIQDILDELQISKGAFYHYFDSKQALLEALMERLAEEMDQLLTPIVYDPQLPALEKFQRFFDSFNRWKTAQKSFLVTLLPVWFADENAIVRQKQRVLAVKQMTPLLDALIRQGVQEGVMATPYLDQVGKIALTLMFDLSETLGHLFLAFTSEHEDLHNAERVVAAYTNAIERVLGTPEGSLQLVDSHILKEWFFSLKEV